MAGIWNQVVFEEGRKLVWCDKKKKKNGVPMETCLDLMDMSRSTDMARG